MEYDENLVATSGRGYKIYIKKQIRNAAFDELLNKQKEHSKVRDIKYEKFEAQPYIKSPTFTNDDVSVLAALRSHTVRGIRCNFQNLYKPNLHCPLKCWSADDPPIQDTQEHVLSCTRLQLGQDSTVANSKISHDDIYGDLVKQKEVANLFNQLLVIRDTIIQDEAQVHPPADAWTLAPNSAV